MSVLAAPAELATCSYQRAVEGLRDMPGFDKEDAATVEGWDRGETPAAQVAIALRKLGFKTSATLVKDHRRGECICTVAL